MIDKPLAIISRPIFRIFLVTIRSLNLSGNKDNDLASSNENVSILRKKGLNSKKTIREFNNTKKVKYCTFIPKNKGMGINAKIKSR
jgi:hypothetical protein